MQVLWESGDPGATASEIWQMVCADRAVGRTTVLKQIQRLEDRQWLRRIPGEGVVRYVAALDREQTARMLAAEFVDSFFGGSLSELVLSVLDARDITAGDWRSREYAITRWSPPIGLESATFIRRSRLRHPKIFIGVSQNRTVNRSILPDPRTGDGRFIIFPTHGIIAAFP